MCTCNESTVSATTTGTITINYLGPTIEQKVALLDILQRFISYSGGKELDTSVKLAVETKIKDTLASINVN